MIWVPNRALANRRPNQARRSRSDPSVTCPFLQGDPFAQVRTCPPTVPDERFVPGPSPAPRTVPGAGQPRRQPVRAGGRDRGWKPSRGVSRLGGRAIGGAVRADGASPRCPARTRRARGPARRAWAGRHAARLAHEVAQLGLRLQLMPSLEARSRLGRPALLPPGGVWPRAASGSPLTFLAGIDLAELAERDGLPDEGWLFFSEVENDAVVEGLMNGPGGERSWSERAAHLRAPRRRTGRGQDPGGCRVCPRHTLGRRRLAADAPGRL